MNPGKAVLHIAVGATLAGLILSGTAAMAGEDKPALRQAAERAPKPSDVVMNLMITRQGEIVVVDREGKRVSSCHLPSDAKERPGVAKGADGDKNPCPGTTNTSILEVIPVSIVRHVGSKCYTVTMYAGGILQNVTVCTPY